MLYGSDDLQTRHNTRAVARQMQWAMQQCKRQLNGEAGLEDMSQNKQTLQTVDVKPLADVDSSGGAPQPTDEAGDDVEVEEMNVFTASTHASNDFALLG